MGTTRRRALKRATSFASSHFAGIAIVWIFKNDPLPDHSRIFVPVDFYWPAALMVVTLFFDLLQYITGARAWRKHADQSEALEKKEKAGTVLEIPDAPTTINDVSRSFYKLKFVTLVLGYLVLAWNLTPHLRLRDTSQAAQVAPAPSCLPLCPSPAPPGH